MGKEYITSIWRIRRHVDVRRMNTHNTRVQKLWTTGSMSHEMNVDGRCARHHSWCENVEANNGITAGRKSAVRHTLFRRCKITAKIQRQDTPLSRRRKTTTIHVELSRKAQNPPASQDIKGVQKNQNGISFWPTSKPSTNPSSKPSSQLIP